MRRRPTVLLDCDGVLADFISAWLATANEIAGTKFHYSDVKTWEISDSTRTLTKEQIADVYAEVKHPGWCSRIEPYPTAVEGVKLLRKHADVVIVTSPMSGAPEWTHEREAWLKKYFDIHHHDVIHASKKFHVIGDIFVDDRSEHVLHWVQTHLRPAVLWGKKYNEEAWRENPWLQKFRVQKLITRIDFFEPDPWGQLIQLCDRTAFE